MNAFNSPLQLLFYFLMKYTKKKIDFTISIAQMLLSIVWNRNKCMLHCTKISNINFTRFTEKIGTKNMYRKTYFFYSNSQILGIRSFHG